MLHINIKIMHMTKISRNFTRIKSITDLVRGLIKGQCHGRPSWSLHDSQDTCPLGKPKNTNTIDWKNMPAGTINGTMNMITFFSLLAFLTVF